MFNRIMAAVCALTISAAAFAQQGTPNETGLERRVRELEQRVQQMQKNGSTPELDEVRRQIDILTREVEKLKSGEKTAAQADVAQYGFGAAASKVYRSEPGVSLGGYGEFLYQNFSGTSTDTAGMLRGVLYTGYKFSNRALFNSELEVEGASTESGGTVSMEFAYLDYLIRPALNVRAGIVLIPVGLVNEQHEPTAYFGARRPVVETAIIPATWGEIGAGVFGDVGSVSYRGYVVTGLNSAKFSGQGIREGRQAGADAKANSWAVVGRADWHPVEGTMFGGSLYSGNSGQSAGFNGRVTLGEVHADSKFHGASFRALYARGTIGDAAAINDANGLRASESVGKAFGGWYVEGGYDIAAMLRRGDYSLSPYVRYERFDTQRSVPIGFERNPENDGRVLTFGAAFKPVPQSVIKADWQRVNNRARSGVNQFNIGLGYIF